ncbi:helix-turn-helix domain-containing protein [Faecalibacter rhinopitheci]|uniref:NUMOD4 motif-containing protein n=1 Tax=Faecalibacter rhinopitheci TaxID=2779678 RepID=A0A8J7K4E9_9FLAO|nr:NUMOD4 domain-containing protein [Faecalibacter rhinopitheci]MBF0597469.1 hypothetical protein [Faecalibacter rhinopitheci]MBQ0147498.1 hypothetical protein [Candidatus Onthonaster equi]
MINVLVGEVFKKLELEGEQKNNYAISNYGRLARYTETIEDGSELKGSLVNGYKVFRYKTSKNGKISNHSKMFSRMVAEHFLETPSNDQTYLLHKDYKKDNCQATNLFWANKEEFKIHFMNSPLYEEGKKKSQLTRQKMDGNKLTSTQVMRIKKMLADPDRKTRLKIIAKQFGISEMQLYRIKSGENWGHIKIN